MAGLLTMQLGVIISIEKMVCYHSLFHIMEVKKYMNHLEKKLLKVWEYDNI